MCIKAECNINYYIRCFKIGVTFDIRNIIKKVGRVSSDSQTKLGQPLKNAWRLNSILQPKNYKQQYVGIYFAKPKMYMFV